MADYNYSKKSDAALEKMIQKDSGASVEQAEAAYNELSRRKGDMGFTVTMILGGRKMDSKPSSEVPLPKKKPTEPKKMNKGGYANCGASVPAAQSSSYRK
jgi:hypothetical protein